MWSAPPRRHTGRPTAGGGRVSERPSVPHRCRWCRGTEGETVLDLGDQPAADHFPLVGEPGPDPAYPLQMWLCTACGLAQLLVDPTVPKEPRGAEPRALVERAARVAAGGVLLLQYHSLATIVRLGQWNSLRHGHYAYYSTAALSRMLAGVGFVPRQAWRFDLYGGTVLLAATRDDDADPGSGLGVRDLLEEEAALGVEDPTR